MKRILTLIFSVWLFQSLTAQEFDVRSFEAESSDMAALRYPRTTVNDEPAALIKVITNITDMSFDSNQGIVYVERKEAEYWVYVAPRERRIRLMAPDFLAKDVSLPEPAKEATVYHLIVTAKGLPETLNVIPVNIIVEGHDDAVLLINEEAFPVNQTISLPRGENAIRIEKQGYRVIDQNILVNEENTLFRFALEGINEEVVTIRSYPHGASIIINRVRQDGVTDFQTFLFPGTYDLRLILDEYRDVETTITVQENQSNEFVFDLERYAGTLTLDITPDDATILINQRNYTGQEQITLAPGMVRLVVEKDGYYSHEERFQIIEGQTTELSVVLNPKTGSLRFLSSSPDAAYVLINSAGEEFTQWSGTTLIRELPIGSYRYEGVLDGYVKLVRQIVIRENEQTTVNAVFTDEMKLDHVAKHAEHASDKDVETQLYAEFEVLGLMISPDQVSARRFEKRNANNEAAALIKIATYIQGMGFETDAGVVEVQERTNGYWVYISPRERAITLKASGYPAKAVTLPEVAESHKVYEMTVVNKHGEPLDRQTITSIDQLVRTTSDNHRRLSRRERQKLDNARITYAAFKDDASFSRKQFTANIDKGRDTGYRRRFSYPVYAPPAGHGGTQGKATERIGRFKVNYLDDDAAQGILSVRSDAHTRRGFDHSEAEVRFIRHRRVIYDYSFFWPILLFEIQYDDANNQPSGEIIYGSFLVSITDHYFIGLKLLRGFDYDDQGNDLDWAYLGLINNFAYRHSRSVGAYINLGYTLYGKEYTYINKPPYLEFEKDFNIPIILEFGLRLYVTNWFSINAEASVLPVQRLRAGAGLHLF